MTPEQEQIMMDLIESQHTLLVEIKALTEEHVTIAREYKAWVGDPLKRGIFAARVVMHLVAWMTGGLLTLWGMKQLFAEWFIFRDK